MLEESQKTLAKEIALEGIGIHSGNTVSLTLKPAPENSGFQFYRTDVLDSPQISAEISKVKETERATSIQEGSLKIQTVEHVLSALAGMGIDNAVIEINSNEPPICDGSSKEFVEMIQKAGTREQKEQRKVYQIREPLHVSDDRGGFITIVPDSKFRISVTAIDDQENMTEYYSSEITPGIYEKEIAPARTFSPIEDIDYLLKKNLIKGASIENSLLIKGEEVFSKEGLRYKNEFARHKVLDIIGDLSLFQKRISGHVVAIKPSHALNVKLARKLNENHLEILSMIPQKSVIKGEVVLGINEIQKIISHRYPFLLIDRVISLGNGECTAIKNVTINEPFFQGHFPNFPIMPGVLQIEAMAQAASILLLETEERRGGFMGLFMSADKIKFRHPVTPGDTLFIKAKTIKQRKSILLAYCECTVGNRVVSSGELMFSVVQT